MSKMFSPPANIDDFQKSATKENELKEAWHKKMNDIVKTLINSGNYPRFYSPLDKPDNLSISKKLISWSGFPRVIESWLNINSLSTPEERDISFRSAEINREVVSISIESYTNGVSLNKFDQDFRGFDLGRGLAMFQVNNNQIDPDSAFYLEERIQDEYLEWFVHKKDNGIVNKISFTSEGPEYWTTLADTDNDLAVRLYKEYVSDLVKKEDLFWQHDIAGPLFSFETTTNTYTFRGYTIIYEKGKYNPYNKWNTTHGIMHLIQRNNTLGAELRLAADATRRYAIRPDSVATTNQFIRFDLCACAEYGAVNRNSDPTIGLDVNSLALDDLSVTISNPIGLYIGEIQVEGIKDADGKTLLKEDVLRIERGDVHPFEPRILRFSIIAPEGADYGLEQCKLGTHFLNTGGPVAQLTSIIIHGEAIPSTASNPVLNCKGKACVHPEKPSYRINIKTNKECADQDWSDVTPPFQVALPENAIAESAESKIKRNFKFSLPENKNAEIIKISAGVEYNIYNKRVD